MGDFYDQTDDRTTDEQRKEPQHRDLCGALFINRKKKKTGQPDRTGTCNVQGTTYRIAGWIKQDREGNNYLSLSFSIPTRKEDL